MRTACIADSHGIVPDLNSNSLFPRQMEKLTKPEAERLYQTIRKEIEIAYSTCIRWLKENGPFDLAVHLGDITGGYQEQGCRHPSAQLIVSRASEDLKTVSPLVHFVIGDHDTGYSHRGSLPGSGINEESVEFLQKTFKELFWAEKIDGILHLGACSPIAQYSGTNSRITRLKREQTEFVGDKLQSHKGEWILYIHRPLAVRFLTKEIKSSIDGLRRMVCGHFHDPKKGRLLNSAAHALGLVSNNTTLKCLKKATLCPSTAPLWCHGYRLLVLDQNGIKSQEITLTPPLESKDIPTSSFWKCLWWMIKRR